MANQNRLQDMPFDTPWFNSQPKDFFNSLNKSKNYNIVLTAETDDFDEETITQWREEGFVVKYVPLGNDGGQRYVQRVRLAGDTFGAAEYYAIVAFSDAASLILQSHLKPNHPKLVAIVAYYPGLIPKPTTKYPPGVKVLVHLAGTEIKLQHHPEVLGLSSSKAKIIKKRIDPGAGYGESLNFGFKTYTYTGLENGFAERDLDEYDPVAEQIAFSRSLSVIRKAFRIDDTETRLEHNRDTLVDATARGVSEKTLISNVRPYAHVLHGPTLTGGAGTVDLKKFYTDFFHPLPPSFRSRLMSRTLGTDASRLVDELYITFTHTTEIPWMLPGIPATQKKVEIVLISIVRMVGGKLESEHVYWDQASVLVQVGLLSPKMVPEKWKKKGVVELPVWGCEGARAMKRAGSSHVNELIEGWDDNGK
ncbi:hypothetical protein LTR78_002758 [Recurvomyces mirabilis]|uniref:Dienelactone hydrolase n=1 Tax=Recurvomyces mirabilis TaxID=574656 RepID=A0AAE0WSE4_9PEZI|nr:hypothetical protein LTR78_002758 [Recurvomyces mirabilis]KAK5159507.1 hypothetical protein LTS14_002649 [Recurvomyces mirabilis]